MKELELQKNLQQLLIESYSIENQKVTILCQNEFKNISTHWAEKPDLIIFHDINYFHPTMKKKILTSPIGLEFKNADTLNAITTGVVIQLQEKYLNQEYIIRKTQEKFKLNSLAFATTLSIKEGIIYKRNFENASNFFIERFCWKGNVAILTKMKNNGLAFSYKNWYFNLNGKSFWHDSRWIE